MSTDVRALIADEAAEAMRRDFPPAGIDVADAILAALAEHGVEVVTDLPDVTVASETALVEGRTYRVADPATQRQIARHRLAIARHLEAEPNPTDVEALADVLVSIRLFDGGVAALETARALLRAGVKLPRTDA